MTRPPLKPPGMTSDVPGVSAFTCETSVVISSKKPAWSLTDEKTEVISVARWKAAWTWPMHCLSDAPASLS